MRVNGSEARGDLSQPTMVMPGGETIMNDTPITGAGRARWWFADGLAVMVALSHVTEHEPRIPRQSDRRTAGLPRSVCGEQLTPWQIVGARLAGRLAALQQIARAGVGPTRRAGAYVAGPWSGVPGLGYRFDQDGDSVVFAERTLYGVAVAGHGVIDGDRVWMRFKAADGSVGEAELVLDGAVLRGTFTSETHGTVTPVLFRR